MMQSVQPPAAYMETATSPPLMGATTNSSVIVSTSSSEAKATMHTTQRSTSQWRIWLVDQLESLVPSPLSLLLDSKVT